MPYRGSDEQRNYDKRYALKHRTSVEWIKLHRPVIWEQIKQRNYDKRYALKQRMSAEWIKLHRPDIWEQINAEAYREVPPIDLHRKRLRRLQLLLEKENEDEKALFG